MRAQQPSEKNLIARLGAALSRLPRDPDCAVFWLTTTLCALFMVFVPPSVLGL